MWLPQLACVSLGVLFSWAQVVPAPSKVQCIGSTCLALYWASRNFYEASAVCESRGGHLPTLDWKSSAMLIKRLMGERPRRLWLGFATSVKNNLSHPEAAGPYCLLVTRQLKRRKRPCQTPADGFFCEYVYPNQTCAPLSLPPLATATYLTPFGAWRKGLLSLPEGTRAELPLGLGGPLTCSPGGTWARDLPGAWDCRLANGGCEGQCRRDDEGRPSCACPEGSVLREEDGRSCRSRCDPLDCQEFCVAQGETAVCLCSEGYALDADGRSCVDVDECQATPGPCKQVCVNTPGSFECRCFPGHECRGKTQDCFDLDCQHECAMVGAQFACICFEGYVTHPKKPQDCVRFCNQTECPAQCDPHTGQSCECPEGYILDVKTDGTYVCADIDECDSGYCGHLQCVNTPGSYSCKCPNGRFVQNDIFCE